MSEPLRVLLVEDSPTDAKLILHELKREGRPIEHLRVETPAAMRAALEADRWHVILCDWSMPHFSATAALALVREMALDVPIIIASGTIGEELAVDAMRAGAHDYVLKGKLSRLLPAIEREIREAEGRAARRLAEAAVVDERARFKALVEASADGIVLARTDGTIAYASPAATRMFGRTNDELESAPVFGFFAPDETASPGALLPQLQREPGARVTTQRRLLRPDGAVRLVEATLTNALGNPAVNAIIVNVRDITERTEAEAALSIARIRFDRLFESGVIGVVIATLDGKIHDANDAYLAMIGRSREEVAAGRIQWTDILLPENAAKDVAAGLQLMETGRAAPWETAVRRPDGTRVPVLCGIASLGEGSSISFVVDLTDRKRTEEALLVAEDRFAKLFESGIIGICIARVGGTVLEANDAYLAMLGYTRADLLTGTLSWQRTTTPEARAWTAGRAAPEEQEYVRKDGSHVPLLVGVTALTGEQVLTVAIDLSARKHAEATLHETERQLRHAQKMEAVGRLAGGIAHDFNNMLSVILSYSELLLDDLREGDPIKNDVRAIRTAALRSAELTRQLLLFSRQQVVTPKVIDLDELLKHMVSMLRRLLGETVSLTIDGDGDARVRVDPGSIEQVLMNLAVNARDAMPEGGTLVLVTTALTLDDGDARCDPGMRGGAFVELRATDTGSGIDEATRARIFEPFFTTKEIGRGTGLGLSTVFGIVQQSGGSIRVASELGTGTTFSIYLPRVDATVDKAPGPATGAARGDETILLVEDEESLRAVAGGILKRAGYQVLEAQNAGEAVLVCESHRGVIHLILTDVVMPRLSGPDLAERLLLMRPEMRVLCMSGYTDDSLVKRAVREGRFAFLQKPITPDTLTRKVREVLDEER